MNIKKKTLFIIIISMLIVPFSVHAFWPWTKNKTEKQVVESQVKVELSETDKSLAGAKYKLWEDSFEKKNVNEVITNKNNYIITVSELNYLFNSENDKAKKPLLNNFKLKNNNSLLEISADFKKHIKGNFSFSAQIEDVDNKIRLKLSKAKLYGVPIPASLVSKPINKALDEYFKFLYQDKRYQGFDFIINKDLLQLKFNFE